MSGSRKRGDELFRRAVEAFEAGDLETARDLFERVLELGGKYRKEAERYLARLRGPVVGAAPPPSILVGGGEGERAAAPPRRNWLDSLRRGIGFGRREAREDREIESSMPWSVTELPPPPGASPPAPEPASAAQQVLRRTPHMDLSPSPPVQPGTRLKVSVYTDSAPMRQEEEGEDVILEGPPEQKSFEVRVWLVVGGPFAVEGPDVQPLTILRDQERSEPAEFTVIRQPTGAGSGKATFSAYFAYNGRACGKVSRAVPLAAGEAAPVPAESTGIRIDAGAGPADLNVRIVASEEDERLFECNIQTPLLPRYRNGETGTWRLKSLAADLVGQQMERFTASGAQNQVRTIALRSAGIHLFEASPKLFQKVLWEMIDAGKAPKTISIVTEEPYIPWELMVPTRTGADGEEEQREPLGAEFLVSRWTSREHVAAPQRIPIRDSWVVAPRDSQLTNAEKEAVMVLHEIPGERIDPAGIALLDNALSQHGRTLLHVVCHGKSGAAGGQILELENEEELDASYLRAMPGVKKAFRASRPFVFLNACEVGREEPALVGVGGFAEQFMALGASGVIAPLWSVKDSIAHQLAVEFYQRIESEPKTPFAEILRDLRKRSYAEGGGEDTWAAYCFYGDPLATRAG
jgi:hypothetical protein